MKNLLTILLFCFLCLPVFGQMTKESAKEMITGINLQDYNRLFIVTDITASNNPRNFQVEESTLRINSRTLKFDFRDEYLVIGSKINNRATIYIPYGKIKMIGTNLPNGIFRRRNSIHIYLTE